MRRVETFFFPFSPFLLLNHTFERDGVDLYPAIRKVLDEGRANGPERTLLLIHLLRKAGVTVRAAALARPDAPFLTELARISLAIEVASIGNEGAVGGIVSCGEAPAFARAQVQIEGQALEVSLETLEQAKKQSGHIRNLFCRFSDYLLSQVMRSVACNSFHSIDQRAAGWLLTAQDRAGDRITVIPIWNFCDWENDAYEYTLAIEPRTLDVPGA